MNSEGLSAVPKRVGQNTPHNIASLRTVMCNYIMEVHWINGIHTI